MKTIDRMLRSKAQLGYTWRIARSGTEAVIAPYVGNVRRVPTVPAQRSPRPSAR